MEALRERTYKALYGKHYGTPTDLWGFRAPPASGAPARIGREFVHANGELLKLHGIERHIRLRDVIHSLGADHVILQQSHLGMRIHRAYVTVHLDRARRVYLLKNRAVPRERLPEKARFRLRVAAAQRRGLRELSLSSREADFGIPEKVWFPKGDGLRPAFKLRIHRQRPPAEWLVYVDGRTGEVLSLYDNLAHSRSALVFDPNPVAVVKDWRTLLKQGRPLLPPEETYARVALKGLDASGYLDGPRVTTCDTPGRCKGRNGDFLFRCRHAGFEEVMAYFHIDGAIRYLESLGYRGARRRIFERPLIVNARGSRADNSWYSPGLRRITFGTGGVDDAEDGETILHEFGHALQDAICPDFGQSAQAAAMGEGFGDYFAASYFSAKKPRRLQPVVMSWDGLLCGDDPPCVRRLDSPGTFESFDPEGDEHDNGLIWSATLWDIWRAMGRDVADRIIVESHFQLDGFTTFARGARAIVDADRHLFRGAHREQLKRIFTVRGIGPVE